MGFFDKIFGSKAAATKFSGQKMTVLAPIDSTVIPLEQLPLPSWAPAAAWSPPAIWSTPPLTAP